MDDRKRRYDPPAFMTDFNDIPGQLQAWSDAVSGWFEETIANEQDSVGEGNTVQYYNQLKLQPVGDAIEAEIVWNAFPKTLRMIFGNRAYQVAERLYPLSMKVIPGAGPFFGGPQWNNLFYRPLDEYCEFRVERDREGKIVRVTFTSEPPEYWQALHGDTLQDFSGQPRYKVPGDPQKLLALYHEFVDPAVMLEDLLCPEDYVDYSQTPPALIYARGSYNPYNKWNSTHGIAHLGQPNNTLGAEIHLGGDATVLRKDANGNPVTIPDALICASLYGGANRTSDPTIGAIVNDIARAGAYVTLRNPVGLYMDGIDLAGFEMPNGNPVTEDFFLVKRGRPGMIERAVFEVPKGMDFIVGDLRVGGRPLEYGGQIAEHINIKLVGLAASFGHFNNAPQPSIGACYIKPTLSRLLYGREVTDPLPEGVWPAFTNAGTPQAKFTSMQVKLLNESSLALTDERLALALPVDHQTEAAVERAGTRPHAPHRVRF